MKYLKTALMIAWLLLPFLLLAQNDGGHPDEAMDNFLLAILAIFFSVLMTAAILGACLGLIALFFVFVLIAAGALSASIAIGLYKRSFASGFKTFLVLFFAVTGALIGGTGAVLIASFFHISITGSTLFVIATCGGAVGGMITGLVIYKITRVLMRYLMERLKIPIT